MRPAVLSTRDTAITTHEETVRARAYDRYELRGRIDGHAEDDWLHEEHELTESTRKHSSTPF
jgi:hypothetical protein